jgi:hypothetical protein
MPVFLGLSRGHASCFVERMGKYVRDPGIGIVLLVLCFAAACGGSTVPDVGRSPSGGSSSGGSSSGGSSSGGSSSGGSSSGGSSSGSFDAGNVDAGYLACMDSQGTIDATLKRCQTDGDCVIRQEEVDCCGTVLMVGLSVASIAAFPACETAWEAHFPACGCASGRTETEDGKTANPGHDAGAPQVHCTDFTTGGGVCRTFTP